MKYVLQRDLANELVRRNLVPPDSTAVTLVVGVEGVLRLQYEVMVTPDRLIALGDAFCTCGLQQLLPPEAD
jgi:hypothetical protein